MSLSFAGARLKVRRAYCHLSVYENQVRRFFKTKPYRVSFHLNRKRTEGRFNVAIRKPLPQDEWGPIIGDCVHNARAALDHLVWELSETFSGPDATDRDTQFPIYDAPHASMSFTDRAERRIKRLPIFAQALVEELQPYHARHPMDHPLCLCRDFDDTDKHKLVPVVLAVVQSPGASWSGGHLRIVESRFINGPFENGAEVGFVRCAVPVRPRVKVKTYFAIVEAFSERPPYIDSDMEGPVKSCLWFWRSFLSGFRTARVIVGGRA